jgi:hypothetical protein
MRESRSSSSRARVLPKALPLGGLFAGFGWFVQGLGFSQRFQTWTFARLSLVSENAVHIAFASEFGEHPSDRGCACIGHCRISAVK